MTFYETISAAIADIVAHGFDSQKRLDDWLIKIKKAAVRSLVSPKVLEQHLKATLTTIYRRMVEKGGVFQYHPGIPKFTIASIKPKLHAELRRRIMASANLIVLNRDESVNNTLRRFAGWMSSVPAGGSKTQDKAEVKTTIRKALVSLPFEERRVLIDQGHKLIASINDIVAQDGGALAAVWHSNWRQKNYDYREDHKERDEKVYLIRDSWAHKAGFVKPGKVGYLDQITQPAEEPFCRCHASYLYALKRLPPEMLTAKGVAEIARVKELLAA